MFLSPARTHPVIILHFCFPTTINYPRSPPQNICCSRELKRQSITELSTSPDQSSDFSSALYFPLSRKYFEFGAESIDDPDKLAGRSIIRRLSPSNFFSDEYAPSLLRDKWIFKNLLMDKESFIGRFFGEL